MYACQCFPPLLILELKLMHWLRFWELLFNVSKNVQENIRPFFLDSVWNSFYSSQIQFLLYFELQWLTINLTSILSFSSKESPRISQKLHYTPPKLPLLNPILTLFPQSETELPLKQICLQKKCKTVLVIAMIRWRAACSLCARSFTDVSSASSHPRRWVILILQLGKWKLREM